MSAPLKYVEIAIRNDKVAGHPVVSLSKAPCSGHKALSLLSAASDINF